MTCLGWGGLQRNFGQSLGLQLNIPIYNNRQVKINIERAKLGVISNEVAKEQARQQLRTEIEQTLTAVRASQRTLDRKLNFLAALCCKYHHRILGR